MFLLFDKHDTQLGTIPLFFFSLPCSKLLLQCTYNNPQYYYYFLFSSINLLTMSFKSPLTDCTNAALQAMNCVTFAAGKKSAARYTHKPYITGLLNPNEGSSADEYEAVYSTPMAYSAFSGSAGWGSNEMISGPSSPFPLRTTSYSSFASSPSDLDCLYRSRHTKPFDDHSHRDSLFSASPSPSCHTFHATPGSGSPLLLRHPGSASMFGAAGHSVEVRVQLRSCEEDFYIHDLVKIAGTDDASMLINSYVLVEGDRGEDMGRVVEILRTPSPAATSGLKRVLRVANAEELAKFASLDKEEKEALEVCLKCIKKVGLNVDICIEGAVFQFDKKKLTIQYTADCYVDFTQLTRVLHNSYKCRIWMDQLNRSTALQDKKSRQKSQQVLNGKRRPVGRKSSETKQ